MNDVLLYNWIVLDFIKMAKHILSYIIPLNFGFMKNSPFVWMIFFHQPLNVKSIRKLVFTTNYSVLS